MFAVAVRVAIFTLPVSFGMLAVGVRLSLFAVAVRVRILAVAETYADQGGVLVRRTKWLRQ